VIAAIRLRTSNKQGRHLSTAEAIRLLEAYGIDTPDGHVRAPQGVLKKPTINRYLKHWGYDRETLPRPPPAIRFQARDSNDCWHFDLGPSDLKQVKAPAWFHEGRGHPLLMHHSVVDDRSGVAYQEYHGVYGEDVEAALRFLVAAMAPKAHEECPFQGRPLMLYMDNRPIARSLVFQQVLRYLDIELCTPMPQSTASRHATARAKGKDVAIREYAVAADSPWGGGDHARSGQSLCGRRLPRGARGYPGCRSVSPAAESRGRS
jgi:hypothetical protein